MGRRRNGAAMAVAGMIALAGTAAPAASLGGVPVRIPELSEEAARGRAAFHRFCSICHGSDAGGTNSGPPLVHRFYRPDHHGNMAFVLAARRGARAHHWRFGDMPPVPEVGDAELADIISFVREVQKANGIY